VALDIANRGYQVVPQYKFADKRIDLVVQGDRAQLAVECYGDHWHGSEHFHEDLLRQRKLERSGWHFFIVRESFYRAAPAKALEHLWKALDERAIYPVRFGGSEGSPEIDETFEAGTCSGEEANAEEVLEENGEEENGRGAQESMAGAEPFLRVGQEDEPRTIQEALGAKRDEIGRTIIEILQERPNHSCVRENMPTYILKRWAVRTRGLPRRKFAKKVDDIIAAMERNGHVSVYKSKNVRIRLGWHRYPGVDVAREIANGPRLASKEEQQE
jgi:very-short-patch-repair endonuclease